MTDFSDVSLSFQKHVAVVEINRPPNNFFDLSLIEQIADALEQIDKDSNCRSIVLASKGKAFCAGANFGTGQLDGSGSKDFTETGFQNTTGKLYTEAARLFYNRKPIIGAIQGPAIGGGLGLALVSDFRIGSTSSRFSANFVKLGLHQGFGISSTLPRLIGIQAANSMLLTGRRLNGHEALKIGLIDQLVADGEVRNAAHKLAHEIAENAPLAVMSVRATMRKDIAETVKKITEHELKEQQWLRSTSDSYEGIVAVAERRTGVFKGA